jgi:predicted O-linked N-acetylglucosamine transferase (SPINDLY family)
MTDPARAAEAHEAGRLEEAAALYRQALVESPRSAALLNNLGAVLWQLGRADEAVECYRQAAEAAPEQAVPHFNLGEALLRTGRPAEALLPLRAAATLEPGLHAAWATLGEALLALRQPSAALAALRRAADDDGPTRRRTGDALQMLGRLEEALPYYAEALALAPRDAEAFYGQGRALLALERPAEALSAFRRCHDLAPGHAAAFHDQGKALFQLGCVEEAMSLFRRAAQDGATDVQDVARESLAIVAPGSPGEDNASILALRRDWASRLPCRSGARRPRRTSGPVRLGYVSAFFHRPNWMKPVWAMVNRHDRARFQVCLFADAPAGASFEGYRPHAEDRTHLTAGMSNEDVASRIAREEVDVLVDLNGFSAPRRLALFALRPAPAQAGWFNLYATSGMEALDVLIGDQHVLPPGDEERFYAERIARVPGSCLAFEVTHPAPDVTPPPYRSAGCFTFGCLASQYKLTTPVIAAWSEILNRAPGSRLLIRNATLGQESAREHLQSRFDACGIPPGRLLLEGPASHFEFLSTYGRIDLALDPFPYSGGTTTAEALWQGVPVVTYDPGRWAGRTTLSQLRAAGLDDFIAPSLEGYIALAARHASSPEPLEALRSGMRERLHTSPLCDVEKLTRSLEDVYLRLHEEHSGH